MLLKQENLTNSNKMNESEIYHAKWNKSNLYNLIYTEPAQA